MARTRKQVRKGDRIYWAGKMFEVAHVIFYDYACGIWEVEFIDTNGYRRIWNQESDGGVLVTKNRLAINRFGDDVTDLFVKYGQPL